MIEDQHRRQRRRSDLDLFVAPLAQQIEEEDAALERIDHVVRPSVHHVFERRREDSGKSARFRSGGIFGRSGLRCRLMCHLISKEGCVGRCSGLLGRRVVPIRFISPASAASGCRRTPGMLGYAAVTHRRPIRPTGRLSGAGRNRRQLACWPCQATRGTV